MSNQEEEQFVDAFPPPPVYYKLYGKDSLVTPPAPPKPIDGAFYCFGQMYTVRTMRINVLNY